MINIIELFKIFLNFYILKRKLQSKKCYNQLQMFLHPHFPVILVLMVQLTNDASSVSKCSAVNKNYFKDDFIQEFVGKKKARASLINLGYYTRAVIINELIINFIKFVNAQKYLKFQIVSCGSGFDTTYWKLSKANLLNKSLFVEIDYSNVIHRKKFLINVSQKLRSFIDQSSYTQESSGVTKMNFNYYLLEADLCDIDLIEKLFKCICIDYDIPTLFLSECVITYMKESDSSKLIEWMAKKFKNCGFINYEQIHSEDGFGQVMLKHFEKLQSSLFSVSKYADCESHCSRYKNLGFEKSFAISEWDALIWFTSEKERQRVLSLELFDEFEEFHMKCVHYVIAVAGNGISSDWINLFPQFKNSLNGFFKKMSLKTDIHYCNLELFRHSSCYVNESSLVFGGCSRQGRSSKIYKISYADHLDIKEMRITGQTTVSLDMIYGSVVHFEINKGHFVCLYGGRKSPDKVWNAGFPLIFEIVDNQLQQKLVVSEGNPISRYRTPMVSLNTSENEVYCWLFGGRTPNLNQSLHDFWRLSIKYDNKKNLIYNWKCYEEEKENWPCSRVSHSFTACLERSELFIVGGLMVNSSRVLNDMWKWSCKSESWEEVLLIGNLLPRYGHTAHFKDDMIYLVGGVNTLAGVQPELARIDLRNRTVVEYSISLSLPEPFLLVNHTSELIINDENSYICIFGGGGNCFSFGTYLNKCALYLKLSDFG